jgi:MFS family permease
MGAGSLGLLIFSALFLQRQFYTSTPIAEWKLFRSRSYSAATAYLLFSNLVMYTTLLAIPFFIKEVQHKGSATTGTLLGAMSILMVVVAPLSGRLSDAWGRRQPVLAGGLVLVAGAILLLVGLDRGVSYGYLAASLAILGLGVGLSTGPASAAAIEAAPRHLAGTAAGTNSMMRYLGSIVGAGILGAVLSTGTGGPGVSLFHLIFAVLVAMAALACVSALFVHRFPPETPAPSVQPLPAGARALGAARSSRAEP